MIHEAGCSGLVHWDDSEGWHEGWEGGSGWEIHVNPWLIHVLYGENHHNTVKKLASKQKKKKMKKKKGIHIGVIEMKIDNISSFLCMWKK